MSDALKPCPFCGGEADLWGDTIGDVVEYSVGCVDANCAAHISFFKAEHNAVAAWNKRAPVRFGDEHPGYDAGELLVQLFDAEHDRFVLELDIDDIWTDKGCVKQTAHPDDLWWPLPGTGGGE